MAQIFVIMGKSSSGKDTIFSKLVGQADCGLRTVTMYTTRPMRDGEADGREYFFTDEEGFQRLKDRGKIIEAREYHTFHGLWRYFTVDDGQIEPEYSYIMISTLEAYRHLQVYFGADRIVPVLIELDDGIRLQRALNRELKQENIC